MDKYTTQSVLKNAELQRYKNLKSGTGRAKLVLFGISGASLLFAFVNKTYLASQAQKEVDFRKERLQQPITELTDSNGTTIPWSSKNVEEWLYKPVRITGRPLHNRACLIPSSSYGLAGYQYVVPLCTKETKDGIPIEGVFLNKGFIPREYSHVSSRYRIEDSFHQQEFTAYVSKLEDHSEHSALQQGNSPGHIARNKWNYADLHDMAKVAPFENQSAVKAAVLESVNLDTPVDERDAHHIDVNSDYREDYPYRKTMSGALQKPRMPWYYQNRGDNWSAVAFGAAFLGLLL